ncbi:ABC-2 family transporter protein [Patescibacteria group bacterium]|nr:ABC-2 family transporter protein [Patescibacteria group bacterium]
MTDLQYRLNFVFSFFATASWLVAELLFINFLISDYSSIAGWNTYEIGLLLGTNQIWVGGFFYLIIWPSLGTFAEYVRTGSSDKIFTYPINARFYVSTFKTNWTSLTILLNGLILIGYCFFKLGYLPNLPQILTYIFFMLISGWMIYCIQFIATSIVFWVTNAGSFLYIVNTIDRLSRFPYEIYTKGAFFILFTFVIPIALISNVPSRALLGIFDFKYAVYSILVALALTALSGLVWKAGLKKYESASS